MFRGSPRADATLDPPEAIAASSLREIGFGDFLLWFVRRRRRFTVRGRSMWPVLQDGDGILAAPLRRGEPTPGDIVVFKRPDRDDLWLIKRVEAVLDDGSLVVVGENPAWSTDSRAFGPVPRDRVYGRVVCRFA